MSSPARPQTNSPRPSSMPVFLPPDTPRLRGFTTSLARTGSFGSHRFSRSTVSSLDALSTSTTSKSSLVCAATDASASSMYRRWLYVSTTSVTAGFVTRGMFAARSAVALQCRLRGVPTAHAVDAAAGRGRAGAEVDALHRRDPGVDRDRRAREGLAEVAAPAVDVAADVVGVVGLHLGGVHGSVADDGVAEGGGEPRELVLDRRGSVR